MSTVEPVPGAREEIPVLPKRRRWRGLLRFALGLAIFVMLALGVLRVTSLWGIPDAPEPFDVAAFLGETIPADQNAVVLFDRAIEMLGGPREVEAFRMMGSRAKSYLEEKPETFDWIEKNRPAMEVWRQGTERPDAMPTDAVVPRWSPIPLDHHLFSWLRVAAIEAGRLEHEGDLEGAWRWHRARLRGTLLAGRRKGVECRRGTSGLFSEVARLAGDWARDPKVTVPLLRRAIADVEAMAPLHGTEAESLRTEYLALMADFDDFADPSPGHPDLATRAAVLPRSAFASPVAGLTSQIVPPEMLRPIYARVASFVEAEPERSRRIARMIVANWLAQADKRPADRATTVSTYPLVFDEDAGPTPSLPPATLARRASAAPYFAIARSGFAPPPAWWYALDQWPTLYTADRQARADLILSLADRIYEIEQGKPPATVEALVGTVLPKLPDDYGLSAGTASEGTSPKPSGP
ncbi:MAG TPA: hypothetical protein VGH33_20455 [Isosphaeraceae bacterium]